MSYQLLSIFPSLLAVRFGEIAAVLADCILGSSTDKLLAVAAPSWRGTALTNPFPSQRSRLRMWAQLGESEQGVADGGAAPPEQTEALRVARPCPAHMRNC